MMTKQFKYWLVQGREIEFKYNGCEYFIGNYDEGRAIFKGNKLESKYYLDINKFLEEASINGVLLKNILASGDLNIITVF